MTYATLDHLKDRYTERLLLDLTDRGDVPTGEIDAGVVERQLINTDAAIDGYLAGKYRLPLNEVPPIVRDLAEQIAIYKLHSYDPPAKIKDDYDASMRQLREIANGTVRLPIAGVEPRDRNDGGVRTSDRDRPFSNENLHGFI